MILPLNRQDVVKLMLTHGKNYDVFQYLGLHVDSHTFEKWILDNWVWLSRDFGLEIVRKPWCYCLYHNRNRVYWFSRHHGKYLWRLAQRYEKE